MMDPKCAMCILYLTHMHFEWIFPVNKQKQQILSQKSQIHTEFISKMINRIEKQRCFIFFDHNFCDRIFTMLDIFGQKL